MRRTFVISSIFEGIQPSFYFGREQQFLQSLGIDPDVPASDSASDLKTAGIIRPVNYESFSSTEIDAAPIAIITNPKNALTYVVLTNGKLISYTSALTSAAAVSIGQVAGSNARGAFYYNNYIYILGTGSSKDDVSRYGPLSSSPSLVDNVWKGATLGSQTALTDTSYPATLFSHGYLNHDGYVHVDNKAYFFDFKNGVGYIHFIKTLKTTAEGDTNDGSTYGALDLPLNYIPTVCGPLGNDVVVAATPTTSSAINQGNAKLFFWNTTDDSFYRSVPLPDPLCTALKYNNGVLYGISGDLNTGVRLWRYVGGDAVETLEFVPDGHPPVQGAVDFVGNRMVWGAFTTDPINTSGLMAYGSKSDLFPRGLHHIALSAFT